MAMITSLYRCAQCGSSEVIPYTEKGKCRVSAFHMTKREEIIHFKCPVCNAVSSDCMSNERKAEVDMALLLQPSFREELREFAMEYENIEIEPYTFALAQGR